MPLTFRGYSSSDSQESENLNVISAQKEVKEKTPETDIPPVSSPTQDKKLDEKYELVRAVPYREPAERKFSTGSSDTSSKSIAKMILNKKKNSFDEGIKAELSKSSYQNDTKVSVGGGVRKADNDLINEKMESSDGGIGAKEEIKPITGKKVSFQNGRKNDDFNNKENKPSSSVMDRSRGCPSFFVDCDLVECITIQVPAVTV